jgi:sugar lactone lactonase YvrE
VRRWTLLFSLASLILLGAAGAVWFWAFYEPERPLEPAWDAVVTTIAGGGTLGSTSADPFAVHFSDPFGIAAAADGTIFVADGVDAHRIVRLAGDGTVSVVAGSTAGFADGRGTDARFNTPSGIALDAAGTIYVADTGNDAIRRIGPDGTVSTIAGPEAGLNGPVGVAVDPSGRVIVADTYNDRIVAIAPGGAISPLAGSAGPGFTDGATASFHTPCGVTIDAAGNIYVADTGNDAVRVIDASGVVSTVVAGWDAPIAVAAAGGSMFVAGARGRVLEIGPNQVPRVVAGGGRGYADGAGASARFRSPSGIAAIAPGRLLVTDRRNGLVRLIAAGSQLELRAPAPPLAPRFDAEAFDRSPLLWPFAPFEGPFEVTGTLGEPRGGDGSERFHAGLDVQAPEGTPVHVVREASSDEPLATNAFGTLNESVRIGPVAYVHLRVGRDRRDRALDDERFVVSRDEFGKVSGIRLKRGSRFAAGEVIGTVNRFYHAHVNVGWPGEELNPLRFRLTHFTDTIPPVIVNGGVQVIGEDGLPLTTRTRRRLVVEGRVRIVVDAWDHVDGNLARRRLGLYRLGYQLLDARGIPMPGFEQPLETIRFDRHPDADAARIVYASGSGIPVYGNRRTRFLYVVTSTLRDGVATDGVFDTTTIPPGDYVLRILAADISGNEATRNRDLPITIPQRVIE